MKINKKRVIKNLYRLGEIGKDPEGGITRLPFSPEYYQAAEEIKSIMRQAGLRVQQDGTDSIFGKRAGLDNTLPSIMFGSHLDTVKNGGLFDGMLGIIAALECILVLNEQSITTRHPLEVAVFNAEEGGELGGTFASRIMVGIQDPEEEKLRGKIEKCGMTVDDLKSSRREIDEIGAFLELHIEQGRVLENEGCCIGIVKGVVGITRYKITVKGEANHAGTTPMNLRKDALTAASRLVIAIEEIACSLPKPYVATVGKLDIHPGSMCIIPGQVDMILEIRDLNQERVADSVERYKEVAEKISGDHISFNKLIDKPAVTKDQRIIEFIEKACQESSIQYKIMASGAGHDAKEIARRIPTGLIFVPSKGGRSHCPEEWTSRKDIYRGIEVLLQSILLIDKML